MSGQPDTRISPAVWLSRQAATLVASVAAAADYWRGKRQYTGRSVVSVPARLSISDKGATSAVQTFHVLTLLRHQVKTKSLLRQEAAFAKFLHIPRRAGDDAF